MKNRLQIVAAMVMLCAVSLLQAQSYKYNATLDTLTGANGLVVDNSGRIWYQSNNDSSGIQVLNPDGTPAAISPIFNVTIGGTEYNLGKGATGMNIFPDGSILVASGGALYKINSQTGEGIARWEKAGISRPAVDASGNVYVTKVVGVAPMWKLDQNLANETFIGDSLYVWGRSLEVTPDGKDLYAGSLWQHVISRYHSEDGTTYTLTDTLLGADVITGNSPIVKWDRKGRLWIGQEVDAGDPSLPFLVYDLTQGAVVDTLESPTDDNYWMRPRGLGFSLTGDTLYIIDFDRGYLNEWIKQAPPAALFDNFEDGDTVNVLGGSWQKTGGLAGTLAYEVASTGYNSSKSLHITGKYTNWAGVESTLKPDGSALDISDYKGIRFAVKAVILDTVRIRVREKKRVDDGTYEFAKYDFLPTSDWTIVTVPFAFLVSSYTGQPLAVPFVATDITQIDFASFKPNRDADFYIDDIELVGTVSLIRRNNAFVPEKHYLSQNYPNPFNPSTTIAFTIRSAGFTTLKVYDLLGKEVASLVNEELTAGSYSVKLDAFRFSSGVYFYTLTTSSFTQTKKMLLMK